MATMSELNCDFFPVSPDVEADGHAQHPFGNCGDLALEGLEFFGQLGFPAPTLNDSGADHREKVDHSVIRLFVDEVGRRCCPREAHPTNAID